MKRTQTVLIQSKTNVFHAFSPKALNPIFESGRSSDFLLFFENLPTQKHEQWLKYSFKKTTVQKTIWRLQHREMLRTYTLFPFNLVFKLKPNSRSNLNKKYY